MSQRVSMRSSYNLLLMLLLLLSSSSQALTLSQKELRLEQGDHATVEVRQTKGRLSLSNANSRVAAAKLQDGKLRIDALTPGATEIKVRDRRSDAQLTIVVQSAPPLAVTPQSLQIVTGRSATLVASNVRGTLTYAVADPSHISVIQQGNQLTVSGREQGSTSITLRDARSALTIPVTISSGSVPPMTGKFSLTAWNDLGMHCMDADYSVFSILPPFNNLHAQLVNAQTGDLVTTGVTLTYEAVADPSGSINSTSMGKSNFWLYADQLFGSVLKPDIGLTGKSTPGMLPRAMDFRAATGEFVAEGIPITPYDDNGNKSFYPMVKVVAKDTSGRTLATASVVLPVSDEMSCVSCHGSRTQGNSAELAAQPADGWVFDNDPERDYRKNILKLHDEKSSGSAVFMAALAARGYSGAGLLASVESGKPILCAGCHGSNALPGTGLAGIAPLTQSMHGLHATVADPRNSLALDDSDNRSACYQCHPGSETRCLRGAMGNATQSDGSMTMQCQSCHGSMSTVGAVDRVGWLEQPNCQSCHHDGIRETSALDGDGKVKDFHATADQRFASNPDTPATGFSLFRMSEGHGGLQCEACHGATHAEYPSSHDNDNILSISLQGFAGTLSECSVCHTNVPLTVSGGPHGMHSIGQTWVTKHHDYTEGKERNCAYCHGSDYRGSPLSTVKKDRSFNIGDGRTHTYRQGEEVGCYDCHQGPFH